MKSIFQSKNALVGSVLAIVLLGGSGAMAGATLTAESVKSRHIKNETIAGRDLRDGLRNRIDQPGPQGEQGVPGLDGQDGISGYQIFTTAQDFGGGGIGGAWCGAPDANVEDQGWVVIGGGAKLSTTDIDNGVAVASSWPNTSDPLNPGWSVQLNKPAGIDPGNVDLYAICAKIAG